MASDPPRFMRIPLVSSGMLRIIIFILLVIIAIGFWLYTKQIIDHVREFQKSVITTQKEIFKGIINPLSAEDTGIPSDLFQKGVVESPFPIIFTDSDNNPIPGLWRNVPVSAEDTSEDAINRIQAIVDRMDRSNPPDSIFFQTILPHSDTLIVYNDAPADTLPFAITNQVGMPFLMRNIETAGRDTLELLEELNRLDPDPIRYLREGEPPLVFYGTTGHGSWPLLVAGTDGRVLFWKGFSVPWTADVDTVTTELRRELRPLMLRGNADTIVTTHVAGYDVRLLHYGDPEFLSMIVWLPVIEFAVIVLLIVIGFIGLTGITRAEQHSIWVGMAKETAHQLGTPISSIDGWLELLKIDPDQEMVTQAVTEIGADVKRLTTVAARFSRIGSRPKLQPIDVSNVIEEVLAYFRARVPREQRRIELSGTFDDLKSIDGNHELLNWAFENLIKNAIAAIDRPDGYIRVTGSMTKDFTAVVLDFIDNGKGIPAADQKRIMKPGFTTKKRGWGLGLSLVKRIIEDYHGGRVMLLESRPGAGTTIRVVLPVHR